MRSLVRQVSMGSSFVLAAVLLGVLLMLGCDGGTRGTGVTVNGTLRSSFVQAEAALVRMLEEDRGLADVSVTTEVLDSEGQTLDAQVSTTDLHGNFQVIVRRGDSYLFHFSSEAIEAVVSLDQFPKGLDLKEVAVSFEARNSSVVEINSVRFNGEEAAQDPSSEDSGSAGGESSSDSVADPVADSSPEDSSSQSSNGDQDAGSDAENPSAPSVPTGGSADAPSATPPPTPTPQATPTPTPTPDPGDGGGEGSGDDDDDDDDESDLVTICHNPSGNPNNAKTLEVPQAALAGHLGHGDSLGACS